MNKTEFLKLPAEPVPQVIIAGRFYQVSRTFLKKYYTGDSFHLHLYDYSGSVKIGDSTFRFKPRAMTIIPPFTEYSYDLPHAGYHYCIHFCVEKRNNSVNKLTLPIFSQMGNDIECDLLKEKLKEIIEFKFLENKNKTASIAAGITLLQMFCHISIRENDIKKTISSSSLTAVAKAASIIDTNLHFPYPTKISSLAKEVGLSQNYLAHLFKERYGMTMTAYQTKKRIELATYLLLHSDIRIREIGERCGLPDPQHFNKRFRKFTGMSPSDVRAGQEEKNHEFRIL